MRNPLFLLILTLPAFIFARQGDTAFYRHQWSVGETNAMSHVFADGLSGPTTHVVSEQLFTRSDIKYLPSYTLHIRVKYSLGINRYIRLETGLGYMLEGVTEKVVAAPPIYIWQDVYTGYVFTQKLTVPLYVKFLKRLRQGSFTCTVGPEFVFPIQSFTKEHHLQSSGPGINTTERKRYSSLQSIYESSMGVNLKMGYEIYFLHATVDVGPVVNFGDILLLDKTRREDYRASGYRPYHYYIGVDVSVYFGVRGKNK